VSLLTNLVSYWKLDEASGDALDSHSTNHLTETSGTIGSTTGKIGNCRDFELGDTEYFTIADSAALSTGDIDFTLACWVNLESKTASQRQTLISKYNTTGNQREYWLTYNPQTAPGTSNPFGFTISATGSSTVVIRESTTFGTPSTGTWYFVVAWHDSVANTVNIQVNNGTVDSTSHSGGVFDGTSPFVLGARETVDNLDGLLDEVGFWKRVLTSDERTALYNGGNGLAYPFATGSGPLIDGRLTRSNLINGGMLVSC
jgi:hypothetical protein